MPTYEFLCPKCDYLFEELLIQSEEIKKYQESHPCPKCRTKSPRAASAVNFTFNVKTPGNSGVHDIDYPKNIDVVVGRSAEKKWQKYNVRKAARDKFRKEHGVTAVTEHNGKIMPTSSKKLAIRQKVLNMLLESKKAER